MENKVFIEGVLLSIPKLTEFGSILFRVKNTRSFKKKDGTQQETSYVAIVSARGPLAQTISKRFTKGDFVRIEGSLTIKKTKNIDEEGREVWETWIQAFKVDAMVQQQNLAPLPENLTTPATQKQNQEYATIRKELKQATPVPVFKKQVNLVPQQQQVEIPVDDEDPFGDRNGFRF